MDMTKFLAKHSVELAGIADVLGSLVRALPLDRQDRERLSVTVEAIGQGAANIAAAVVRERSKAPPRSPAPKLETRVVPAPGAAPAAKPAPAKRPRKAKPKATDAGSSAS